MLKVENHILLPGFETNTWLLWDDESGEALLIDPAAPSEELLSRIEELKLRVLYIVNTHGHGDHIGGNKFFKSKLQAPVMIHPADAGMLVDNKRISASIWARPWKQWRRILWRMNKPN